MPKPFSSENQPANRKSGPNIKAKIIAALGRRGMTEDEFMDKLLDLALDQGGVFMTELLKRYNPIPKQTFEPVVIDNWPKDGTAAEKANVVLDHLADGNIPADLASMMIESISKSLGIAEVTELARRLEAIEKLLDEKAPNA